MTSTVLTVLLNQPTCLQNMSNLFVGKWQILKTVMLNSAKRHVDNSGNYADALEFLIN